MVTEALITIEEIIIIEKITIIIIETIIIIDKNNKMKNKLQIMNPNKKNKLEKIIEDSKLTLMMNKISPLFDYFFINFI